MHKHKHILREGRRKMEEKEELVDFSLEFYGFIMQ
jgi:hypothetical protein